jgi:hypothetical protein
MHRQLIFKQFLLFVFANSIAFTCFSQHTLKGKIVDRETGQPLPFVNIVYNQKGQGIITSLEGNFEIVTALPITELKTSYVGYIPLSIKVKQENYNRPMLIGLAPATYNLEEVVVKPGINPAHRIINEVIKNRDRNNPEQLPKFRYHSYNKMYFTALRDSSVNRNSQQGGSSKAKSNDSLELKVEKLLSRQHLFMMESVTERIFMQPNRNSETILASKVSGLKDPLLSFIATQYQSFSFYPEFLNLGGKYHLNPISKGSSKRYLFILEDTLFTPDADTLFVISFRPLLKSNFAGLKGVMNINSNGYAIQSVIAEPIEPPSPTFNIKIQQRYELIGGVQWFPVELNTNLLLTNTIAQARDSLNKNPVLLRMIGIGNCFIRDIELNPDLKTRNFSHVEVSFDPQSSLRDEAYWMKYRYDSLTNQERRTYRFVDSLSQKSNLNRMMGMFDALILGKIPLGYFNVDLKHILNYNRFEGYRLGVGLETNRRVSKWFTVGGHYAYGFKDREDKFGGFAKGTISQLHQINIEGRYEFDVREPGLVEFERQFGLINSDLFRNFMINKMDYVEKISGRLGFRLFKRFTFGLVGSQSQFNVASGFQYNHPALSDPRFFSTNELGAEVKFTWNEAFIQTNKGLLPFKFEHPIVWFNYFRGIEYNHTGFNYNRFEMRFTHLINHKTIGKTSITFSGGIIKGDVPTPLLYFTPGSMDKYPLDATNSFATMLPFEFVSDRYAYAFFRHNFGSYFGKTKSKIFKPQFEVVQNFAIGNYQTNPTHNFSNIQPKVLAKGYFESGILLHGILSNPFYSMGLGAYYRWGHNANPKWDNNLAVKITLATNF